MLNVRFLYCHAIYYAFLHFEIYNSSHKESWRATPLSKELKKRWGERRLPKSPSPVNFTQTSSGSKRSRKEFEEENGWPSADRTDDEWCEPVEHQCQQKPLLFLRKRRKLLQFDKSYRPAYYGSFSKVRWGSLSILGIILLICHPK
jgi:hypothetical protein